MVDRLTDGIASVIEQARPLARTERAAADLDQIEERLTGPLRLAIAGRIKAGKSTLLNAMLGEELAPTDAGECTRIVTWYRQSYRPYAKAFPVTARPRELVYRREGRALSVDLGELSVEDVDRLEIGWPTSRLQEMTVIDTPGIASISVDLSARTQRVLARAGGQAPVADAVLYLLRHTHSSDLRFLEAFHDEDVMHGTPINTVGVLSRADEIGSCRLDAMSVADRVARRYEADPRLHRLCPVIVPVDGLLAFAAATLREAEFALLAKIAAVPPGEIADLLLTADRFLDRPTDAGPTQAQRHDLLSRFGLFGVRLSVELIRSGVTRNATELAHQLAETSGLDRLRAVLLQQFEHRTRLLKARSAIAALDDLFRGDEFDEPTLLAGRVEQITAGAHEFEEIRLLFDLRSGTLELRDDHAAVLDRLLGGSGHGAAARLGLPDEADQPEIRQAALRQLAEWRVLAEHPLTRRSAQIAARGAARTIEGLLAESVG